MFKQHVKDSARDEEIRSSRTLFKMNKFRNVEGRTNTHNGPRRALSYAALP
jgi:hypothetical protein